MKIYFLISTIYLTTAAALPTYNEEIDKDIAQRYGLFPNAFVSYRIAPHDYDTNVEYRVKAAIEMINNLTCLDLIEAPVSTDIFQQPQLIIKFRNFCQGTRKFFYKPATIYWPQKPAVLLLNPLEDYTIVVARFLNALAGLRYEHQRADRDNYVRINWENIREGYEDQFAKFDDYPPNLTEFRAYSYASFMNVGSYYQSKNGKPTIEPLKTNFKKPITNVDGDMKRVNAVYTQLIHRWYYHGLLFKYKGPLCCANLTSLKSQPLPDIPI